MRKLPVTVRFLDISHIYKNSNISNCYIQHCNLLFISNNTKQLHGQKLVQRVENKSNPTSGTNEVISPTLY